MDRLLCAERPPSPQGIARQRQDGKAVSDSEQPLLHEPNFWTPLYCSHSVATSSPERKNLQIPEQLNVFLDRDKYLSSRFRFLMLFGIVSLSYICLSTMGHISSYPAHV